MVSKSKAVNQFSTVPSILTSLIKLKLSPSSDFTVLIYLSFTRLNDFILSNSFNKWGWIYDTFEDPKIDKRSSSEMK